MLLHDHALPTPGITTHYQTLLPEGSEFARTDKDDRGTAGSRSTVEEHTSGKTKQTTLREMEDTSQGDDDKLIIGK